MIPYVEMPIAFLNTQRSNAAENFLPHMHDYYEISYLTGGKTKIKLNGLILPFEPYDYLLIPPKVRHNLYYSKEDMLNSHTIWFHANSDFMAGLCRDTQIVQIHDYDGSLQFLSSEIFRLFHHYNTDEDRLFNAYLYTLLLQMQRGRVMDTLVDASASEDQIEHAVRFINEHVIKESITVSAVAEELGLSPAHFNRLFQKRIGIAPIKYIIEVKMSHAKRLLLTENISIKEIATALHYDDQLYFSRQFTKATGLSPRRYRTEMHNVRT